MGKRPTESNLLFLGLERYAETPYVYHSNSPVSYREPEPGYEYLWLPGESANALTFIIR